jgi:hypothetical protein
VGRLIVAGLRADITAALRQNPLVPTSTDVPADLERLIDQLSDASLFLA